MYVRSWTINGMHLWSYTFPLSNFDKPWTLISKCLNHHQPRTHISNNYDYLNSILKKCSNHADVQCIHSHIRKLKAEQDTFLGNLLISRYGKVGSLDSAFNVFNVIHRDVVSWNTMIGVYMSQDMHKDALQFFSSMQNESFIPSRATYLIILRACSSLKMSQKGKEIHTIIFSNGLEPDVSIGTAIITMYGKQGHLDDAISAFWRCHQYNLICWTSMITAFAQQGRANEALYLFFQMEKEDIYPDEFTFVSALNACSAQSTLCCGQQIHIRLTCTKLEGKLVVCNALLHMYGECEALTDACCVFNNMHERDVISWTTMIALYAKLGCSKEAFQMYSQMQNDGIKPNNVTYVNILMACTSSRALIEGSLVHTNVVEMGVEIDDMIVSALVKIYGKSGCIEEAWTTFHMGDHKNIVTWNTMLTVLVEQEFWEKAFNFFVAMVKQFMKVDVTTFLGIVAACGNLVRLEEGLLAHVWFVCHGLESSSVLTALIAMYGKCSAMDEAVSLFRMTREHDVCSMNALITAYSQQGNADAAFVIFLNMLKINLKPDNATFTNLLTACSYAGLVYEGILCFIVMRVACFMHPAIEHYGCIIDLIGRAGCLHEAQTFLNMIPLQPNPFLLTTLLGACKLHGDQELASSLVQSAIYLDPLCKAPYLFDRWCKQYSIQKQQERSPLDIYSKA